MKRDMSSIEAFQKEGEYDVSRRGAARRTEERDATRACTTSSARSAWTSSWPGSTSSR